MYRWRRKSARYESLAARVSAPVGYRRIEVLPQSFGYWLRHLPLLPQGTAVRSYRGKLILPANDPALAAVVDLDLGSRNLQQCADTALRLRGEYLYWRGLGDRAAFVWNGSRRFGYAEWRRGIRPVKVDGRWAFAARAGPLRGYDSFRRYLQYMFLWTGTQHQVSEPRVRDPRRVEPGDFLVQGGSPGHLVIVLDLARAIRSNRIVALIGQGFMPAQDLHVLRSKTGSAWFELDFDRPLVETPLWRPFRWGELRRFKN
jgi:hypothetical protein